jgi:protein-tyrosine phosphatase
MTPDIYKVNQIGEGILYVMPRPSSDWIQEDASYFCNMNINVVVSLLEKDEEFQLGLSNESNVLEGLGIEFVSYPIQDRGLPNPIVFGDFVTTVYSQLIAGKNVAIHCRAGIGRTGVLSSCLLVLDGYDAQAAIDMVSFARGIPVPDTTEQFDFICDFRSSADARGKRTIYPLPPLEKGG